MNLCVIPARSGSKRIPKKNIKNFYGKPIIAWSIEAAIKSNCFDKVLVSTDDHEIVELAKSYGAEAPFIRPKKLADDYAATVPVISHAIKWQIENFKKPTYVCCIYATAPFIQLNYLRRGLKLLKDTNCEYTFSATNYAYPIQRSFRIKKNNKIKMFDTKYYNLRTQDLEEVYHDVGQFYWATADTWLKNKKIIGENSIPIIIPRSRAIDIDTPIDWQIAEIMFEVFNFKK